MNEINSDFDIRSKIIITDCLSIGNLKQYSDIELAAIFSKNENNFIILKLLLEKNIKKFNNKKKNNIVKLIVKYFDSTADLNAVKLLISYGTDINYMGKGCWTLLMDYCFIDTRKIEIINFLIENGSNINTKNTYSQPLTLVIKFCSKYSDLEIIKLLIRKGGNINFKTHNFETPLMMCFDHLYNSLIRYDIIKLLLDNKADVYIKKKNNENIFDIIKSNLGKNSDIYSLIFNYKNLEGDHFCEYDIDFIYNIL